MSVQHHKQVQELIESIEADTRACVESQNDLKQDVTQQKD